MKRTEFEHVIRAAAAVAGVDRLIVIGSQAIHGQFTNPPHELLVSAEADFVSPDNTDHADLIDGAIGELSPFHRAFGYYGHGLGEGAAVLPRGWKQRLLAFHTPNTGGATALCLEVHDLAVSKLAAGREKDRQYLAALLRHRLADPDVIRRRLAETEMDERLRAECAARLESVVSSAR